MLFTRCDLFFLPKVAPCLETTNLLRLLLLPVLEFSDVGPVSPILPRHAETDLVDHAPFQPY
jgi:hypothetical protein